MISVNSNCSRIDAVKATSRQLEMQVEGTSRQTPKSEGYRKAKDQIQTLNNEIKSGDAKKAEQALSTASRTVQQLETQKPSAQNFRVRLDTYA